MNTRVRPLLAAGFLSVVLADCAMCLPALYVNPSPGGPWATGMTVGWDFTITNDTPGYIEITSAQYCRGPFNFPSSCEAPTAGTFTDFISAYNDIVVGPPGGTLPSTVTQEFNLALRSGIGSLAIDPGLPVPFTESGFIVLTYSVFDIDPNLPGAIQYGFDQVLLAEADISVQVQGSSQVPEPSTWMTVVVGGMAAFALRRRRA